MTYVVTLEQLVKEHNDKETDDNVKKQNEKLYNEFIRLEKMTEDAYVKAMNPYYLTPDHLESPEERGEYYFLLNHKHQLSQKLHEELAKLFVRLLSLKRPFTDEEKKELATIESCIQHGNTILSLDNINDIKDFETIGTKLDTQIKTLETQIKDLQPSVDRENIWRCVIDILVMLSGPALMVAGFAMMATGVGAGLGAGLFLLGLVTTFPGIFLGAVGISGLILNKQSRAMWDLQSDKKAYDNCSLLFHKRKEIATMEDEKLWKDEKVRRRAL